MDRVYMNRIDGQRRIHVEITDSEVSDLLEDLQPDSEHYDSTRAFLAILEAAEERFSPVAAAARRDRAAARQTTPAGPCGCGAPTAPDVVHRQGAPCCMDQDGGLQSVELPTAAARQTAGHDDTGPTLRDQLRRAICEASGFTWDTDMLEPDEYGDHADAVLKVLGELLPERKAFTAPTTADDPTPLC